MQLKSKEKRISVDGSLNKAYPKYTHTNFKISLAILQ